MELQGGQRLSLLIIEGFASRRSPGLMVRRLDQTVKALAERRFASEQVTLTQWITLKVVYDGVVSKPGDLARDLNITSGATTRLVDTLEKRELMRRDHSSQDRRTVRLELTGRGETMVQAITPAVVAVWNELLTEFPESQVQQFRGTLGRLLTRAGRMLEAE